ncbi:MAG TPA: AMP-binding protein [Acidimicrobiia bacterium]
MIDPDRATPPELAQRYVRDGYWNDDTLGQLLDGYLSAAPSLTFRIWSATRPYEGTYRDVHELARRVAAGLRARGVGPGDVVAFQMPNCVEAAATFWGLSLIGAVIVPIVHFYGAHEIAFILRESGARVHLTADRFGHSDYLAALDEARPEAPELEDVFVVGSAGDGYSSFADLVDAEPIASPIAVDPSSAAFIAYTSGTTANPKGVVHSHRSAVAEVRTKIPYRVLPAGDPPNLVGAPVSHAIGMLGGLLAPLAWREPVHLTDVWDPPAVLAAMLAGHLTAGSGSPFFLTSLLDCPELTDAHLALIRHVAIGGAPVPTALADRARALGISIVRGYGSTEHPSTTSSLHEDPEDQRLRSDGVAQPGVDLRIVDDDGRELGRGEAGEIQSRGPDLCTGYTDAALTKAAFDDDGWYSTGDVGTLDERGCLHVIDRKKDIIIRGGEKVSAVEVEGLVLQLPSVAEVALVPAPDARLGEHGCAFVRTHPGQEPPDLAGLRTHLEACGLARQKWPEELHVVSDFPRTASGKIKKHELRDRLRTGGHAWG